MKHTNAGGAELNQFEITRRLVKYGFEVTILSEHVKEAPSEEIIEGVKHVRRGGKIFVQLMHTGRVSSKENLPLLWLISGGRI